jgi:RHS repeat-associated protein
VTSQTDEQGRTTHFEYAFPSHQVTQRVNPDGSKLQYAYNNRFNFLSDIVNERGETYHIEYAPTGHVSREVTFDGREFRYEYDAHTQLVAKTEVGSEGTELTTRYAYNAQGRLTHKILPDEQEIQYHYDRFGRLTEVDDGHWPLAYRYNLLGQLEEEHQGWVSQGYRYDAMGQLNAMLLPDGQVVDYLLSKGQLQQVNLNGQRLTTHDYQVNGLETQRQQGALTSHYQYDELGRLLEHSARQSSPHPSSPQILRRRYEYSQAGNLTSVDDVQRGLTQYHYDPLDRLTSVRGVLEEHFSHDPAGNLLLDRRTHVVGNKLLLQGDKHYQYDEFGNLIRESRGREQKLVTEYRYDTQHRLIHVTKPDGSEAHYQYDAFGRRIEKQVTDKLWHTEKTEFLWQGDKLIAESSESHYQTYLYEYGSFRPLALITGEGAENAHAYFYHLDQVGTPLEMTDHDGAIAWAVDYRAYGNVARERVQDITSPLRFQGQYYDEETGLHYNRHRYYSPETGRYITVDPIGLAGGLNNYQYAKNPTGWVDPLGLSQKVGACPCSNSHNEPPIIKGLDPQPIDAPNTLDRNGRWHDSTGKFVKESWPTQDGFASKNGKLIRERITLPVGKELDRFGGWYEDGVFRDRGSFFGDVGAPFENRALPPKSLNSPYKKYRVAKSFEVDSGPIAPWFGEPGGAVQYLILESRGVEGLIKSGKIIPIE